MMLKKLFALLLAPAALATPVAEKELDVRVTSVHQPTIVRYRPDFNEICASHGYGRNALTTGRTCYALGEFTIHCLHILHGHGHPAPQEIVSVIGQCDPLFFCVHTQGTSSTIASAEYIRSGGPTNIECISQEEYERQSLPPGTGGGQTPLSRRPPGPEGTMYGHFQVTGDLEGMSPEPTLEWDYRDSLSNANHRFSEYIPNGKELKAKQVNYIVQLGFDHDAQFFGAIDRLNSKRRNTIKLEAAIHWDLSGPFSKRAELEDREALGNARHPKRTAEEEEALAKAARDVREGKVMVRAERDA